MNNLIFEIGVENIPARFITGACAQMKEMAEKYFKENNISYTSINSYGTYRRLILYVEGIPSKIPEKEEKFYGPPARLLKNEKNEYTPQAIGFAKSHNTTPEKLLQEEVPGKGLVLCVVKKIPETPVEKVLGEILLKIIKGLQFPKNMIWEDTRFRFARPIRNLLAIYGKKTIKLEIAGVKTSKFTTGLLLKNLKKIRINSAEEYFKTLERNHIIVRDDKRKEYLINELEKLSLRTGLKVEDDQSLIEENIYLSEYPVCVLVKYPSEFLKLPKELILLVMKKQLKFFPCYDEKGNLQPYFVGIRDGVSKGQRYVEEGFLNVFEARGRDALFFYENDLKLKPEYLTDKIKNISFQEKLGTIYEKSLRVRNNLQYILDVLNYPDKDRILKIAEYLYLDLATNVVREFPELQGIMSYYYAESWGIKDDEMKKAISEVYFPISSYSALPSNLAGALLSISEKIDTIAGDFIIGDIPTGSQDPHGLRRNAYGIVRIVFEYNLKFSLKELVEKSLSNFNILEKSNTQKICNSVMDFIFQRVENYFQEKGFKSDVIESVKEIFMRKGDLLSIYKRISAIKEIYDSEIFYSLSLLYKRAKNILKSQNIHGDIDEKLFEKEIENKLYDTLKSLTIKKDELLKKEDFSSIFREIENLKNPLEDFFKEVLVMVEDEKKRNNRLLLIYEVYSLFEDLADISKIQR